MAKLSRYPKLDNIQLWNAWCNMRRRCNNKNSKDAKNYALRGITYDPSWNSWESFCDDMAEGYQVGLTLDRIDNDKGYSKENCRWVTRTVQNRNRRVTPMFTIGEETLCMSEWIERSDVKSSTVRQRYYVMKQPIEVALGFKQKERIAP